MPLCPPNSVVRVFSILRPQLVRLACSNEAAILRGAERPWAIGVEWAGRRQSRGWHDDAAFGIVEIEKHFRDCFGT